MSVFQTLLGVSEEERDRFLRQFDEDPVPFLRALRDMGPVVQDPLLGIYHVMARAEIEAVLKNATLFSASANGPILNPLFGVNMAAMDGAAHARLRGLVSAAFTPAAVATYVESTIAPVADATIEGLRGRASCEFVWDFCIRFPLGVIARMLNVPLEDYGRFHAWYETIVEALRGAPLVPEEKQAAGARATRELGDFLRPIVRERMASPTEGDLIGHMALTELEGARLTEDEIVSFSVQLLWVGAETTQRLIATALFGILSTGVRDAVRASERLLEGAIEEALRWCAPAQSLIRKATAETTLAGVTIPKGAFVALEIAAYHLDPAVFEEPEKFKVERRPHHFAFGAGRHICLGAYLARAEAKLGLERFLAAFPNVRLDPSQEVLFRGIGMRSPVAIHLLLE